MNADTPEYQLTDEFIKEMRARVLRDEHVELELSLDYAFAVLAALQLALRYWPSDQLAAGRAREFAVKLERMLSTTPAAAEVCRRGWLESYDECFDGRRN